MPVEYTAVHMYIRKEHVPPNNMNHEHLFRIDCPKCEKPFCIVAKSRSKKTGDEDFAMNCPYCKETIMVKIPKNFIGKGTIFRTIKNFKDNIE